MASRATFNLIPENHRVTGQHASKEWESPQLLYYENHLTRSIGWLTNSIASCGGSRAFLWCFGRWARPYPETSGYIIKTLLDYGRSRGNAESLAQAVLIGQWLLKIQHESGYWHGGTHPPTSKDPSVFNTGQILLGMCALYRQTSESVWRDAAVRAAQWLADQVDDEGRFRQGNYVVGFNPSYYSRVAWPMLEVWELSQDTSLRLAAERVLAQIADRKKKNGVISGWGFRPDHPAFTHTIAYTLRGFLESARITRDWERWGALTQPALEVLMRKAELKSGRLPGCFDDDWKATTSSVCLTGNAQVAICLLALHQYADQDLRILNAAAKLVDYVCQSTMVFHPLKRFRGSIAGSRPIWGKYMAWRRPNWAVKFQSDALMLLVDRLRSVAQT